MNLDMRVMLALTADTSSFKPRFRCTHRGTNLELTDQRQKIRERREILRKLSHHRKGSLQDTFPIGKQIDRKRTHLKSDAASQPPLRYGETRAPARMNSMQPDSPQKSTQATAASLPLNHQIPDTARSAPGFQTT